MKVTRRPAAYKIGGLPTELDFEKALMFFHAYMYGPLQGKLRLYGARSVKAGLVAMASDWEVFASMLVRDLGRKLGAGIDLRNYEVKSAQNGGGYEYQYHKLAGKQKLRQDMKVGHLFFDHRNHLRRVDLRYAHGSWLKENFFLEWFKAFPRPYPQRYRKSVPFKWVKANGVLLMTLEDGEVIFPKMGSGGPRPRK